jgi:hypothetical protein
VGDGGEADFMVVNGELVGGDADRGDDRGDDPLVSAARLGGLTHSVEFILLGGVPGLSPLFRFLT